MPLHPEESRALAEIADLLFVDGAPSPIPLDQVDAAAMAIFGLDARIMADRALWLAEAPSSNLTPYDYSQDSEAFGSPRQ